MSKWLRLWEKTVVWSRGRNCNFCKDFTKHSCKLWKSMPSRRNFNPLYRALLHRRAAALPDVLPHYLWMRVKRRRHSQQWSSLTFRWESKWIMHWLPCARALLPCVLHSSQLGRITESRQTKNLGNWLVILMPAAVWQIFDYAATYAWCISPEREMKIYNSSKFFEKVRQITSS